MIVGHGGALGVGHLNARPAGRCETALVSAVTRSGRLTGGSLRVVDEIPVQTRGTSRPPRNLSHNPTIPSWANLPGPGGPVTGRIIVQRPRSVPRRTCGSDLISAARRPRRGRGRPGGRGLGDFPLRRRRRCV